MSNSQSILIVAGEISGDMHGSRLVEAMKRQSPDLSFYGIGGPRMRDVGVETLYDIKDMAVTGFVEVLKRYPFFHRVFNHMIEVARERQPDAVILIDYPGFNLRYAAKLHALGIKVIYYICPQVWAWHRERIPMMANTVDQLITIFPFEADHFSETRLKVDFAGHPLVDVAQEALAAPLSSLPWNGEPKIALLPGSRMNEIDHIFAAMWASGPVIEKKHPNASFIVAAPSEKIETALKKKIRRFRKSPARWSIVTGDTRQVLRQADAAMVASGTATIETSLMECPMVIVYKMPALTYLLAKKLVKIGSIGMVNIVAETTICPELIQGEANPDTLAAAIDPLLSNSQERNQMITDLREVNAALGGGNAAHRAAELALSALSHPPHKE